MIQSIYDWAETAATRALALLGELTYRVYSLFALITTAISAYSYLKLLTIYQYLKGIWQAVITFLKVGLPAFVMEVVEVATGTLHAVVDVYRDVIANIFRYLGWSLPDLWRDVLFISLMSIGWGVRRALIAPRYVPKLRPRQETRVRKVPIARTWAEWWDGKPDYREEPYTVTVYDNVLAFNLLGIVGAGLTRFTIVGTALVVLFIVDHYYAEKLVGPIRQLPDNTATSSQE